MYGPISALAAVSVTLSCAAVTSAETGVIIVTLHPQTPPHSFIPARALGAGIDGHERAEIGRMLSADNIQAMLSTGLKPLTYRLRTELGIEAWHWNPRGRWSDPNRRQGYWTSDARAGAPITLSYGYRLPRRGNTIDQANNDGYSRLDDGDDATFWKSNPYLAPRFTGGRHPQWVVIDLGAPRNIDTIRLQWGIPYATEYAVQYSTATELDLTAPSATVWQPFLDGILHNAPGGDVTLRLAPQPVVTRYIRIYMTAGSGTAPPGSTDVRDALGYAIREIYLGATDSAGKFHDLIRHGAGRDLQTIMYVSSTDPWHRSRDRDDRVEQPGFDLIFHNGLTNKLPMLTPVPVLYDTPENAAAEIQYLKARAYPVERLELGEEPDGQFVAPEDYAALYLQVADAIRKVDSSVVLGGPSLVTLDPPVKAWMDRFLDFLRAHGRLSDFGFFSFEWYPFDEVCDPTAPQLAESPDLITAAYARFSENETLRRTPWLVAEYGYSAFGSRAEVDLEGALLNAEVVGMFLTLGAERLYLYGYEPNELIQEKNCTWGNNMLFHMDSKGRIVYRTATYWGARLLTHEWIGDSERPHRIFPARSDILNDAGEALVTAFALERPDGQWSVLMLNKDPTHAHSISIRFESAAGGHDRTFTGAADLYQFSSREYLWHVDGERSRPLRSEPPERLECSNGAGEIILPPYSMTVVRGRLSE
jgi:hypothetical protein